MISDFCSLAKYFLLRYHFHIHENESSFISISGLLNPTQLNQLNPMLNGPMLNSHMMNMPATLTQNLIGQNAAMLRVAFIFSKYKVCMEILAKPMLF